MIDPQAFRQPLLAGDPAALAAKLRRAAGLLGELCRERREPTGMLAALAFGEGLPAARAAVQRFVRGLPALDGSEAVELHTWCVCGTALRQAVFFDWLAARDAWSAEEIGETADLFLEFAYKHPLMVSLGRCRASNNQIFSLALFCAVVGFLFGHKLARRPAGRQLFEYGLGRLPDVIGLFPGDGYSGEGSTYTSHVNTPLACWTADFLRTLTGRDWLETRLAPNGTTLRRIIEMEMRIVSPGGLLAGWDHYGWQPAINASPFAYLARATGNPRYLSVIPNCVDWRSAGMLAWGADDALWSALWWPAEWAAYDDRRLPEELFGWFLPKTGAALDDCRRRCRLLQVWDACADLEGALGRAQCDPNHLLFECAGEPVLQDGVPADGRIGSANAIVVDDDRAYWPGRRCVGRPVAAGRGRVSADCAEFYRPRFDVEVARRTSLWHAAGFGVVRDELAARTAHTWTWQAHLRPEVTLTEHTARVRLTNGHEVLLAWLPAEARCVAVEGYPNTYEQRSCRLELRRRGAAAEFVVLIAPDAGTARVVSAARSITRVPLHATRRAAVSGAAVRAAVGPRGPSR